jgi:hypothetical protein
VWMSSSGGECRRTRRCGPLRGLQLNRKPLGRLSFRAGEGIGGLSVGWAVAITNGCEEILMFALMGRSFSDDDNRSRPSLTATKCG